MDPQIEEYRRKQRERAAAGAAKKGGVSTGMKPAVLVVVAIVAAALVAVVNTSVVNTQTSPSSPGTCPEATGMGICVEECSGHDDCESGKMCCSNGCGHVCMDPVVAGERRLARRCTLMVTLANKDDADNVLNAIPKDSTPAQHSHLKAVGIMILEYGAGNISQCCTAEKALQDSAYAKSVEYDGPKPDCASESANGVGEVSALGEPVTPQFVGEPLMGGWSNSANGVDSEALEVWKQLVSKSPSHGEHDLKAFGEPVSVQVQVVAGTNYHFKFRNGAAVTVFHQPWTETLEVTALKP
jgi:hypothetical protein